MSLSSQLVGEADANDLLLKDVVAARRRIVVGVRRCILALYF